MLARVRRAASRCSNSCAPWARRSAASPKPRSRSCARTSRRRSREPGQFVEVARTYAQVADDAVPAHHRRRSTPCTAINLEAIGRRYSDVGRRPSPLNVVQLAVGFADLAGYTGMWHEHEPTSSRRCSHRFEATTGDVIAAVGRERREADRRRGDVRDERARRRVRARARPDRGVRGGAVSPSCGSGSRSAT